jgi:hypothetical protein
MTVLFMWGVYLTSKKGGSSSLAMPSGRDGSNEARVAWHGVGGGNGLGDGMLQWRRAVCV